MTKEPERKSSVESSTDSFEPVDPVTDRSEKSSTASETYDDDHFEAVDAADVVETPAEGQEVEEVDPLDAPMKEDQKQYYTSADSSRAIKNLILFSLALFTLPLLTMFYLYHHYFLEHYPPDEATLYAGLCGIAVVFVLVIAFVMLAYQEEKQAEARLKASKKAE